MKTSTPLFRISLGLVFITTSLLFTMDMLGVLPSEGQQRVESRVQLVEGLAAQLGAAGSARNLRSLRPTLQIAVSQNEDVISAGLRAPHGRLLVGSTDHDVLWAASEGERTNATHVEVPLFVGGKPWASLEVHFREIGHSSFLQAAWSRPMVRVLLLMSTFGFLAYMLYMKRTLRHLDPSSVVPARVQAALDVMSEGVLLLDQHERIVLCNSAFSERLGQPGAQILGRKASDLEWSRVDLACAYATLPWGIAIESGETSHATLFLSNSFGERLSLVVTASPILDGWERPKGAIVTLDDVTELEQKTAELEETIALLEKSQEEIRQRNEELEFMANHDSLTGASNRRFFMATFERAFEEARGGGTAISCVMADIDHFKKTNDEHGHLAGDEAIRRVSEALMSEVRSNDNVCRYGGEEFCLLLTDTHLAGAAAVAERLRRRIDSPGFARVPVTVSFGISSIEDGARTLMELIDQADQALYRAKDSGRNRVERWSPGIRDPR